MISGIEFGKVKPYIILGTRTPRGSSDPPDCPADDRCNPESMGGTSTALSGRGGGQPRATALVVVAVTGMPGSGKSFVARILAERLGYPLLVMGDIVREEVVRRGLELTVHNIEMVAEELRRLGGPGFVAELVVEKAKKLNSQGVIVDGVRSLDEVQILSSLGRVYIVAVHSPPNLRYHRLVSRMREGDVRGVEEFKLRDEANLRLGVGGVIALADYMIVNNSTLDKLREEAERVAGEIRDASKGCSGG